MVLVDEIATHLVDVKRGARPAKVKLIVGDGIAPISGIYSREKILTDRNLIGTLGVADQREQDRACWIQYERYRYTTDNEVPAGPYYALWRMLEEGLVNAIITTNYDQHFNSMLSRDPVGVGYVLNPVNGSTDYDHEGFYSDKTATSNKLRLWKIHGSLSHAAFFEDPLNELHIFRLPRFVVGFPEEDPCNSYGITSYHDHMGPEYTKYRLRVPQSRDNCKYMRHFIDINGFQRSHFQNLIDGAIADLTDPDTAIILVLGFVGSYNTSNISDPYNEELVPPILDMAKTKNIPTYQIVNPAQRKKAETAYLYKELEMIKRTSCFDINGFLNQILLTYLEKLCGDKNGAVGSFTDWSRYYRDKWKSGDLFKL
ncbi:MAG: SIR2 family protein [Nitrospirae bacterium]|nr:SIR2 family protein [Nitrospirota bacterium]